MNEQSEGFITEARLILRIYLKTSTVSVILSHEHFAIAREQTLVDQVIELATVGGSKVEVLRESKTNKQREILAVAVELQTRIVESNHNPRLKIGGIEEVTRFMNTDEFCSFFENFLEFSVNKISTIAFT